MLASVSPSSSEPGITVALVALYGPGPHTWEVLSEYLQKEGREGGTEEGHGQYKMLGRNRGQSADLASSPSLVSPSPGT